MIRPLLTLVGGMLAVWAVTAGLAEWVWPGQRHAVRSALACVICLVPSVVTLLASLWGRNRPGPERILIVFFGVGLRMGAVLGAGAVLHLKGPSIAESTGLEWLADPPARMWAWIVVFYVVSLALETMIVLREPEPGGGHS